MIDNYSKEALKNIVENSLSIAELSKKLGYKTSHGKNYETIQKRLNSLNISTEHFKQTYISKTLTTEDVFCKNSKVSRNTLRRFYLNLNDIEYKCVECGTTNMWNGKPLTLQLDHIDGDGNNNLLNNLRWLCPNCHSQTQTFAGKNVSKERKHYYCVDCGEEISGSQADRCLKCSGIKNRKVARPSKDELEGLLISHKGRFSLIGNMYGVHDNIIRKWCKQYELSSRTSDYIEKKPPKINKSETQLPIPCCMIDKNTNEIIREFPSRSEAARYLGLRDKKASIHIGQVCAGKRKTAYGYKWTNKSNTQQND